MIETGGHGWMGAPATGTSVAGKYSDTVHTHTQCHHMWHAPLPYTCLSSYKEAASERERGGDDGGPAASC